MRALLVFGHNPGPFTGKGSNAWLLPGRVPTLIDTGSGGEAFLTDLRACIAQVGSPIQVLVTHGHPDHAGGARDLAAEFPWLTFRKWPWPESDARWPVAWSALSDEQILDAGDGQLWVIHTPGHAPDHVCFFEPRSATLFGGDLAINGGTIVIPASRGGRLTHYIESLHRVLELRPRRLLPGHGPIVEQPSALLRGYLAHRASRERQIVDSLGSQPATAQELVRRIYPSLRGDLEAAARESVLAHLAKLQEEGRATQERSDSPGEGIWRVG
ncbi:MAG: MBL fold metallo-hydrolase [Vicinamibacterales bacterium]